MKGLEILARSLSVATGGAGKKYKFGRRWQYHPQSDRHSKIACWGVIFDLLRHSEGLQRAVTSDRVGFGINLTMRDFRNNRDKDLDLVIARRIGAKPKRRSFKSLVKHWGIVLAPDEEQMLAALPDIGQIDKTSVIMALEAKACMTEFSKARPRLYDELNSSHNTVHGDTSEAIAAGFVLINTAESFISPKRNNFPIGLMAEDVTTHNQPRDAMLAFGKVKELPRRSNSSDSGFDAMAVGFVSCRNDGSQVVVAKDYVKSQTDFRYDEFIRRLAVLVEPKL
jgi:hypothetical protein